MTILDTYAELKLQEKMIAKQLEDIKKEVLNEVQKQGGNVKHGLGEFYLGHKTNYIYSKKVVALIEEAEIAKIEDVRSGKAKENITEFVSFKINKI
jgi:hypothetical protein